MALGRSLALLLLAFAWACTSPGSGGPGFEDPDDGGTSRPPGSRVFTDDQVLEVRLTLDPADWWRLEEYGNEEVYVPSAVEISGRGFPDLALGEIGLRHKGSWTLHHCWDDFGGVRSYENECQKLSLKMRFDRYDDAARFDGLKRLNLHASPGDGAKLRELLAYATFTDFGVIGPRAAPARVFVNGELRGLFIAVEDVDGRFTRAHFPEGGDGNLYKEIWPRTELDDAHFLEALETNEEVGDVSDMREFAEAIAGSNEQNFVSRMETWLDREGLLRYLAVDRAIKNWDGIMAFYLPYTPHNFYWYRDDGGARLFHLIPWDLDNTFGPFDPFMYPEQWVTAEPVPDWNSEPVDCLRRSVWEAGGSIQVTPPRCDPLLDLLARTSWDRFVEIGEELLEGPFSESELLSKLERRRAQIDALVAEDPILDYGAWQYAVSDLSTIFSTARADFRRLLDAGLIQERPPPDDDLPEEVLLAETDDTGLHAFGVTNFEFAAPPPQPEPSYVFQYGDPRASFLATWNTESPLSGNADLSFEFTFRRGPEPYDEWVGVGIVSGAGEADLGGWDRLVFTASADRDRSVRVRLLSSAYREDWGDILSEFGIDVTVGPTPRRYSIWLDRLSYPQWAKDAWTAEQGFSVPDAEARALVLQRLEGLAFGPMATLNASGELLVEEESGYLRVDDIYFR